MTSRFRPAQGCPSTDSPSAKKSAVVMGMLAAIGVLAWSGCGPGSESRYYCDDGGCYTCDAYGCSAVSPPAHPSCTGASSCPAGQVCTDGGCTTVCSDDSNCPQGEVCKANFCAPPSSTPPTKKDCTTKTDCGDGQICNAGSCQACGGAAGPCPCAGNIDCSGGQVCVAGACTAQENVCKFSSECGDNKICADGQCLVSCETAPCADGFTCDKGVCKPTPGGTTCTGDAQCPAESPKCVGGTCAPSCTGDAQCGAGKYCNQGACVVDTRPSPNCTSDAQCTGSAVAQKCVGGFCKYTCGTDQDCRKIDSRIGYCAKDLVCRTAAEAAAACFGPADCNGKSCVDNQCK